MQVPTKTSAGHDSNVLSAATGLLALGNMPCRMRQYGKDFWQGFIGSGKVDHLSLERKVDPEDKALGQSHGTGMLESWMRRSIL